MSPKAASTSYVDLTISRKLLSRYLPGRILDLHPHVMRGASPPMLNC